MCTIACPQICWDLNLYRNRLLLYIWYALKISSLNSGSSMCSSSVAVLIVPYLQSLIAQHCVWVKIPVEYVTIRSKWGNVLRNVLRQEQYNFSLSTRLPQGWKGNVSVVGSQWLSTVCVGKYTHMPATRYSVARVKSGIMITASQTLDHSIGTPVKHGFATLAPPIRKLVVLQTVLTTYLVPTYRIGLIY